MQTLESIIESYAFDKMQDYGLLLIPLPTGAGKSYTVFSFIHNVIIKRKTTQKILFVTSLKKNLQIEELKSKFTENEQNIFDDKVLLLKSNLDFVLDNWDLVDKDIPYGIKEYNEYKKLNAAIKYCKEMEDNTHFRKNFQILETVKTKKDDIKDMFEPNFRKRIKSLINEAVPPKAGYKAKLTFVKSKMPWLLTLYPQILSNDKQVFLMSMDKFLLRNDPIEEARAYLADDFLRSHLVEISESLLALESNNATQVMGYPDDLKLKSSMTLFLLASGHDSKYEKEAKVFKAVLDKYFGVEMDGQTVEMVQK